MALKYKYIEVDMMDLMLDPENPRFASSELVKKSGSISQKVIIEHLLKHAKIIGLANRINRIKGLHGGDLITCYVENGKYIVLEGNRRVCACKLLLNKELIPNHSKADFPVANEETKENIKKILISLYTDREAVQAYLSDRHIKGIETWSAFEKQNYYMNLFSEFKDLKEVGRFTYDSVTTIRKSIIRYQFFIDVFNLIKDKYPSIAIEDLDYLPLVNRFMSTLVGDDPDVGLDLYLDESNLKYYCDKNTTELYNKILLSVGEAFLVRNERKKYTNEELESGKLTKIVSTELNTIRQQKDIIINNIRIPGLFKLIKEYKGILNNSNIQESQNSDKGVTESKDYDNKKIVDESNIDKARNQQSYLKGEELEAIDSTSAEALQLKVENKKTDKINIMPGEIRLKQNKMRLQIPSKQIDLYEYIDVAINSQGKTIQTSQIEIKVDGKKIKNNILHSVNTACIKSIEYSYLDSNTGFVIEKMLIEFFQPRSKVIANKNYKDTLIYLPTQKEYKVNFNCTLENLVNEINELNSMGGFDEVIVCSLRALFEISVDSIKKDGKFKNIFYGINKLEERVGVVVEYISSKKMYISEISNATEIDFNSLKNILNSDDFKRAVEEANLGAHKSDMYMSKNFDKEYVAKKAAVFIVIVNEMINNNKIV